MRLAVIMLTLYVAGTAFAQPPAPPTPSHPGLTLATSSLQNGGVIPKKYTPSDPNPISPELHGTNVSAGVVKAGGHGGLEFGIVVLQENHNQAASTLRCSH